MPQALRYALLILPLTGAGLLVAAEFSTLYDVRVVTAVPEGGAYAAGPHHGYALALIAAAIVVMAAGAVLGGSRPAAVALALLALAALAVALLVDLPDVHETGLIGRTYDAARAEPRAGPVPRAGGRLRRAAGRGADPAGAAASAQRGREHRALREALRTGRRAQRRNPALHAGGLDVLHVYGGERRSPSGSRRDLDVLHGAGRGRAP